MCNLSKILVQLFLSFVLVGFFPFFLMICTTHVDFSQVPPTNGWMLEFGMADKGKPESFACGYRYATSCVVQICLDLLAITGFLFRVYITGDTLLIDELHEIPKRYAGLGLPVNLMLMHLGGTTIPGPSMPLLMVTMDAKNGVELMQLVKPERTIPIHYE